MRAASFLAALPSLAVAAALAAAPLLLPGYLLGLLTELLILGLFAMSLGLQVGFARMVSFGHAGPYGLGAYLCALLLLKGAVPLVLAVPAAAFGTALVALPVGWLCTRAGGVSFAMLTLAFAQLGYAVAYKWQSLTGGSDGLPGIERLAGPFGLPAPEGREAYHLFVLAVAGAGFLLARAVMRAPLGAAVLAVRENERRAEALGFNPRLVRLALFVLSNALAGLAGALYAGFAQFVSPELLFWAVSGHVLVMVIVGGAGTLAGPFLGAAVVMLLEHELSGVTESWGLALGVIFILVVILAPEGLWGLGQSLARRLGAARAVAAGQAEGGG